MICGGMFLSYGIFNNIIGYQSWSNSLSTFAIFIVPACFHVSIIFGALATSLIYNIFDIFRIHVSYVEVIFIV
jgi:hypothetical protein